MLRITGCVIALLCGLQISVDAQTVVSQTSDYTLWKTPDLYAFANDLLKKGQRLETAITTLTIAVDREPTNLDYQLALGCACASRLSSLAYAQRMLETAQGTKYNFAIRQRIWNETHTNPTSPLFGQSPPAAPSSPFTPDDGKSLELSTEALLKRKMELTGKCLAAFRRAKRLEIGLPVDRRAEAEYLRGWGLLLVERHGKDVLTEITHRDKKKEDTDLVQKDDDLLLSGEEIVNSFNVCTELVPTRTAFWQSLAMAQSPGLFDNIGLHEAYENQQPVGPRDRMEEAVKTMAHAMAIREKDESPTRPKAAELIYQMALLYAPTHPKESAEYLEKLLTKQDGNSTLWYLEAEQWFRCSEKAEEVDKEAFFKKGLKAVETGNQVANIAQGYVTVPIPRLLAAAWNYQPVYNLSDAGRVVLAMFEGLSDSAKWYKEKKNVEGMTKSALPLLQCGLLSIHTYAGRDMLRSEPERYVLLHMRGFYGFCLCLKAYSFMKEANGMAPDGSGSALLAKNANHFEFASAWEKAMTREVKLEGDK